MLAFGIRHEGHRYCFGNHCSVRLQDAIIYARLVAKRTVYVLEANRLTVTASQSPGA